MTPPTTQKLEDLIQEIRYAMMTMMDLDGIMRSRPMTTLESNEEGILWFFAGASHFKAAEVPVHVNLSYADPHAQQYVSISGTAVIVRDSAKMKDLWKPLYLAWFPDGLKDPELVLIRVTTKHAEYWDAPSGKTAQFLKTAKAILTKKKYVADPAEHQRVL